MRLRAELITNDGNVIYINNLSKVVENVDVFVPSLRMNQNMITILKNTDDDSMDTSDLINLKLDIANHEYKSITIYASQLIDGETVDENKVQEYQKGYSFGSIFRTINTDQDSVHNTINIVFYSNILQNIN